MNSVNILVEKIINEQFDEALELVNNIDETYYNDLDYLNASGTLFYYLEDYEKAFTRFSQAVLIDPDNYDALYNLGTVQVMRSDLVSAILNLGKAAEICKVDEQKNELASFIENLSLSASRKYECDFFNRFSLSLYMAIKIPFKKDVIMMAFAQNSQELNVLKLSLQCVIDLMKTKNAQFLYENEILVILIDGIKIAACDQDILYTVSAIFKDAEYDFSCNRDCIIWDVGQNVGITSLRLARMNHVVKIITMEPVKPTFEKGLCNFSMNPEFSKKIEAHNLGLSDEYQDVVINFDPFYTTRSSVFNYNYLETKSSETMHLVKASDFFRTHIEKYSNNHILVLKMDCEGGEYPSLINLIEEDLLKYFSFIELELHQDPSGTYLQQELIDKVTEYGFLCTAVGSLTLGNYTHIRINAYKL